MLQHDAKHNTAMSPNPISFVFTIALAVSFAAKASTKFEEPQGEQAPLQSQQDRGEGSEAMPLLQIAWSHLCPPKNFQGKMQLEQEEQLLAARIGDQEDGRALCCVQ